jgi:hypothetical protein
MRTADARLQESHIGSTGFGSATLNMYAPRTRLAKHEAAHLFTFISQKQLKQMDAWHMFQEPASSSCRRESRGSRAPCLLLARGLCALETMQHAYLFQLFKFRRPRPGAALVP